MTKRVVRDKLPEVQSSTKDVYTAALERIELAITTHEDFYVSFSGGKDSGVLIGLVLEVARKLNKLPVKLVFSDLEVIFEETSRYVRSIMDMPEIDPYWLCLSEMDDNNSSVYQRWFKFWDKTEKLKHGWSRDMPTMSYVITEDNIPSWLQPYYKIRSVEAWTITKFGEALCDKNGTNDIVNFIGMRNDESWGRLMNVHSHANRKKENAHTYQYSHHDPRTWISLPIMDWKVEDVWHYYAINNLPYNRVYDSMYKMGIPLHLQRTCSAFGTEQSKTLNQWCIIEPHTWDRMVTRVSGANFGKIYNHTRLNTGRVTKPANITWKEYTIILMNSLPPIARSIFDDKFRITFNYHKVMYEDKLGLPPSIYIQDAKADSKEIVNAKTKFITKDGEEITLTSRYFIAWEFLAGAIIKRDFVFKKYGFGYSDKMVQIINDAYDEERKITLEQEEQRKMEQLLKEDTKTKANFLSDEEITIKMPYLVKLEHLMPNPWNPNVVARPELELLKTSIRASGFCFPLVVIKKSDTEYMIVDGFHRHLVAKELNMEYVPVVILDDDVSELMSATIRFNRARGTHQVDQMGNIVAEMIGCGMDDEGVSKNLGMCQDEVLRLKQGTGIAELFKDVEYSQEWHPDYLDELFNTK